MGRQRRKPLQRRASRRVRLLHRKRSRCWELMAAASSKPIGRTPFENPTPLSNLMEMFSIFLIPGALTVTLGRMIKAPKHGWAVFAAMAVLFVVGVFVAYYAEAQPNPLLHSVN